MRVHVDERRFVAMGAGRYGMVGRVSAKSIFGSTAGSAAMSAKSCADEELGVGLLCENGEHCRAHANTAPFNGRGTPHLEALCFLSRCLFSFRSSRSSRSSQSWSLQHPLLSQYGMP